MLAALVALSGRIELVGEAAPIGVCVFVLDKFVDRVRGVPLHSDVWWVIGRGEGAEGTNCRDDEGKGAGAMRNAGAALSEGSPSSSLGSS